MLSMLTLLGPTKPEVEIINGLSGTGILDPSSFPRLVNVFEKRGVELSFLTKTKLSKKFFERKKGEGVFISSFLPRAP